MFNVFKWDGARTGYNYMITPQKGTKISGWKQPAVVLGLTIQEYIKFIKTSYDVLLVLNTTTAGLPTGISVSFKYEEEAAHLVELCKSGHKPTSEAADKQFLLANIKNLNERNYTKVEAIMTTAFENETTKTVKSGKITDAELDNILKIAYDNFGDEPFKNADIAPLVRGLTIRQVPSRLKKMVDAGALLDLGGSPKAYKTAR